MRQGHDVLGVLERATAATGDDPDMVMSIWVSSGLVVQDWVDLPLESPWAPVGGTNDVDLIEVD